jgi:hypothetical protein
MARRGEEWVGGDVGRRGLALNGKDGYLPVDTAGERAESLDCSPRKRRRNFADTSHA